MFDPKYFKNKHELFYNPERVSFIIYDYKCKICDIKFLTYIKIPQILIYYVFAGNDVFYFESIEDLYNYKNFPSCNELLIKKLLE